MIQRKQTLYLLLGFLILGSLFFQGMGTYAGPDGVFELRFYGLVDITNPSAPTTFYYVFSLAMLIILPTLLEFIAIFMYKRRPKQMRVCAISTGLQIGLAIMLFIINRMFASELEVEWNFHHACILPLISAVLTYLAYRRIDDDETIVNSLNRLR